MANKWDDDEYVADLLKRDAKSAAKTYKLVGMDAFKHKKRAGQPKPNTNFLRHLIRQTDSHNSAILAKEAAESNLRFRMLNEERNIERTRRQNSKNRDSGRLTPVFSEDDEEEDEKTSKIVHTSVRNKNRHNAAKAEEAPEDSGKARHKRRHRSKERRQNRKRDHSMDENRSSRKRHRRSSCDEHDDKAWMNCDRDRPQGRRKSKSRSPSTSRNHRLSRNQEERKHSNRHYSRQHGQRDKRLEDPSLVDVCDSDKIGQCSALLESDSDPLESLIGPLPLCKESNVQARGRGIQKAKKTDMDSRFATSYDPNKDIYRESDTGDDWDDAVEAFRDRQQWKQQGADRLKTAGFTEMQIAKWEKGTDPNEEDVVWTRKGQAREWDRGKIITEDGRIELKADFGRLK